MKEWPSGLLPVVEAVEALDCPTQPVLFVVSAEAEACFFVVVVVVFVVEAEVRQLLEFFVVASLVQSR